MDCVTPKCSLKVVSLVLKNLIGVQNHLDNIIVYGNSQRSPQPADTVVKGAALKLNAEKCPFNKKKTAVP